MTEDDCCIHELPPGSCSLCKHGLAQRPPPPQTVAYRMAARFEGVCPECKERIEEGDMIAKLVPSERWVL